jgi:hypothetical protein
MRWLFPKDEVNHLDECKNRQAGGCDDFHPFLPAVGLLITVRLYCAITAKGIHDWLVSFVKVVPHGAHFELENRLFPRLRRVSHRGVPPKLDSCITICVTPDFCVLRDTLEAV